MSRNLRLSQKLPIVRVSKVPNRISLFTVLILITAASLLAGVLNIARHHRHEVEATIVRLSQSGAKIAYDDEARGWIAKLKGFLGTNLPTVKRLDLSLCRISGDTIRDINVLPIVKGISFASTDPPLLDRLFCELQTRPDLLRLDLDWTKISDAGVQHVASFPQLVELSLRGLEISDSSLSVLHKLPKLQHLDVRECILLTDGCGPHLEGLADLSTFRISVAEVSGELLSWLAQNKRLQTLEFTGTSIVDRNSAALQELCGLKHLDLASNRVGDATIEHVSHLADLETLNVSQTHVTDIGVRHLSRARKLRRLDLSNTRISVAALDTVSAITELEAVNLAEVSVTFDEMTLEQFTMLRQLNTIGLTGNTVSSAGIGRLSKLPKLRTLYLDRATVTNFDLADFAKLQRLEFVSISESNLSDAQLAALAAALPACQIVDDVKKLFVH